MTSQEIRLRTRPSGLPTPDNFELASTELPALGDGDVLVKNLWMSVDPYMRGRMDGLEDSYVPPFQLGNVLEGGAIGQVAESRHTDFPVGTYVESMFGWRERFVVNCNKAGAAGFDIEGGGIAPRDATLVPPQTYLGIAGMPGLTAYVGLLTVGAAKAGETVFVSAASGAVGAVVCQIAKQHGCGVVGTAGSDDKVKWLQEEAGVDAAINYKTVADLRAALRTACPGGIDVYFENVGGDHLEATLDLMNNGGRVAVCGLISQYNATALPPGPRNFIQILVKSLRVQGFIVTDYWDQYAQFLKTMAGWVGNGQMKWRETVYEGIERAPEALMALFSGDNFGKMLVKLNDPD